MKILHVYNHFYPCVGGIETYMEDLCVHLIKLGHTSDVCCLNKCPESKEKLRPFETHKGIKIIRLPYKDFKYYKISPKILKIIKPYDVIHVHGLGFFSDFLSATKLVHKKPLVLSTHGGIFHTKKIGLVKQPYFYVWSRQSLRNFDRIIAVSRNDEKLFAKISKKVVFIPDGIEFEKYSKIRRRPEASTFLFIGRLSPNKRIDRLIELAHDLKKDMPGIRLYIAGKDWKGERKRLDALVRKKNLAGSVIFTGEVSEKEKISLLSRAEFFVSASEYEGFGISVVEAMAAGVPVIANDIDSFRNFIRNGENGFLADFSNLEMVKSLVMKIKDSDLPQISKNARQEASKYDWKRISEKVDDIYEKCRRAL